jgi:hypothetical protein
VFEPECVLVKKKISDGELENAEAAIFFLPFSTTLNIYVFNLRISSVDML